MAIGVNKSIHVIIITLLLTHRSNGIDDGDHGDERCLGNWGKWTRWSKCKGGRCEYQKARQYKERSCVQKQNRTSRGDMGMAGVMKVGDVVLFKKIMEQECVDNSTCVGVWSTWSEWGRCGKSESCLKFRERTCTNPDSNEKITLDFCIGGSSTFRQTRICDSSPECTGMQKKPRNHETKREGSQVGFDQNAMVVLSVALACLFMGGCLMFGAFRWLGRRRSKHQKWLRGNRGESVNGHSTATTVTTVNSPLPQYNNNEPNFVIPSTSDPNPSFSFSRSVSVSSPNEALVTQNECYLSVPPVNRSDNIYWEILDTRKEVKASPVHRQVVDNILYECSNDL